MAASALPVCAPNVGSLIANRVLQMANWPAGNPMAEALEWGINRCLLRLYGGAHHDAFGLPSGVDLWR